MSKHENIYAALAAARGNVGAIVKDCKNSLYNSRYASLAAIVDAVTPALSAEGLSYSQQVTTTERGESWVVVVHGVLYHESGGVLDFGNLTIPVVPIKGTKGEQPITHAMGSAITYARRYKIGGDLNLVTDDDDDGNANAGPPQGQSKQAPRPAPQQQRPAPATAPRPAESSADDRAAIDGFCARLATCQTLAELGVVAQEIGTQSQAVREGCKQAYVLAKANITEGGGA